MSEPDEGAVPVPLTCPWERRQTTERYSVPGASQQVRPPRFKVTLAALLRLRGGGREGAAAGRPDKVFLKRLLAASSSGRGAHKHVYRALAVPGSGLRAEGVLR